VHRWLVAMHGVPRSLAAGRIEEAERSASACHELALAFDYPDAAVVFAALIFPVRFEQGRLHEVEALFIDMVSRFPNLVVLFQAMLAFLYCELDRDGDASEVFERLAGAGIVPPPLTMNVGLVATAFNAATCAHLADRVRAPELHDALAPFADQLVAQPAVFLGSAAHYLGLLATTLEHFDEAESRFSAAEATHARLGAPGWAARTRLEWARMLLARGAPGDPERARELAGQALASASELGMARVAEQARVLLAG